MKILNGNTSTVASLVLYIFLSNLTVCKLVASKFSFADYNSVFDLRIMMIKLNVEIYYVFFCLLAKNMLVTFSRNSNIYIHFVLVYNYVISKFLQIMILICFTEYSKLLVTIYTHFIIMLLLKNVAKNQWCMERKMLIELAFIFIYYYF